MIASCLFEYLKVPYVSPPHTQVASVVTIIFNYLYDYHNSYKNAQEPPPSHCQSHEQCVVDKLLMSKAISLPDQGIDDE